MSIWVTSDPHFLHDREFIYRPRAVESVREMDEKILMNLQRFVRPSDDLYILGDLMLGGPDRLEDGLKLISQIPGQLHIVRGNHDTDKRWKAYKTLENVVEAKNSIYLRYNGYNFYMSHFPSLTANLAKESLKQCTINLYGHTHQHNNFYQDIPYMYHVGLDSHDCRPVLLDTIIEECKLKVEECKKQL